MDSDVEKIVPSGDANAEPRNTGDERVETREEPASPRRRHFPDFLTGRPVWQVVLAVSALLMLIALFATTYYRNSVLPERVSKEAERSFEEAAYGEALDLYERVHHLDPERPDALYRIAYSLEMLSRDIDAIEAYRSYLAVQSGDAAAHLRLGGIYYRLGRYEETREPLESFLATEASPDLFLKLGRVYQELGSEDRAAEYYGRATAPGVEDVEILYNASLALMKLGKYQDALDGFTRMGRFAGSEDKRSTHSANAAKNMLGWPTDPADVVSPGRAVGLLRIGAGSADIMAAWGAPLERVSWGEHAVWGYGKGSDDIDSLVYLEEGRVIEIATTSTKYRTSDGLGISNFLESRYADRFIRWVDEEGSAARYILKGGGLAFFVIGMRQSAVVYGGNMPLTEDTGYRWIRQD